MSTNRGQYDRFEKLRQRAEELILKAPEAKHEEDTEVTELIHELKIHHAELELQNEELKRSQLELSAQHKKYEELYEFAPCGYITMDANGTIQQINLTAAAILGINRNNLTVHTSFTNYLAQGWKDVFREFLINFEKNGAELKLADKNGDSNWIKADIQPVENVVDQDSIEQWQMTITDITERKQAEEALHRSENYYRAIFETSASAMFIIEEDTTVSHVNSTFLDLFGYSRQKIEGKKSWIQFVHPDDVEWLREVLYLQREDPDFAPRQYEFRGITCNGEERNILASVNMIPETNRSVASGIDITGRKQLEEEFRDYLRESAPPEENTSEQRDSRWAFTAEFVTDKSEAFQKAGLFSRTGEDRNLIRETLEEFFKALHNQLYVLRKAAENGNIQDVHALAYSIKGMAAKIAATGLSETAFKLEILEANQDLWGMEELISELEEEFELLKTEYQKI